MSLAYQFAKTFQIIQGRYTECELEQKFELLFRYHVERRCVYAQRMLTLIYMK